MLYATFSEGFKGCGFVQRVFPPLAETPRFSPEKADVYELGIKSTGLQGRARLNASVFYTRYTDLQIQVFRAVAPVTENAASARITGAELEFDALLPARCQLGLSAGYLDPRYLKIDPAATEIDQSKSFERVSKWSLGLSVANSIPLGSGGSLAGRARGSGTWS